MTLPDSRSIRNVLISCGENIVTMGCLTNGVRMAEAIDRQEDQAARRGVIALQMHPGPPMKVQFRKLRIRIHDPQP